MTLPAAAITRPDRGLEREAGARTGVIRPWRRCGTRQVCRAHVRLGLLPGLSAALASSLAEMSEALRSMLGARVSLDARLGEAAVMPERALSHHATWAVVDLAACSATAAVEVPLALDRALLERLGHAHPRGGEPRRWSRREEASLAGLWLEAIGAVCEASAWRAALAPRLASLYQDRGQVLERLDGLARHLAIDVRVRLDGLVAHATALVPGWAAEAALLRARPPPPPRPVPSQLLSAEVPASVSAGRLALPAGELLALRPGDRLPVAALGWHGGHLVGSARLRTAAFEAHGALFPPGLSLSTFATTVPPKEPAMSDALSHCLLPIEVEVELTRLSLPLSQVATLRPGAVLPLRQSDADPVTLRIGGRAIARAELVDVDGEVGARILSLVSGEEEQP